MRTNYSFDTSLPAYYENAEGKKRQQDIILSLVTESGTCLKEIQNKLIAFYKMEIPQSTVSGRISDLIKEKKVMYFEKIHFDGCTRKKIMPYKEFKQGVINF